MFRSGGQAFLCGLNLSHLRRHSASVPEGFEGAITPEQLKRIESLMKRAGLQVKGVLKMDAGKRSRHTNAYFTGIGKSKRIVLFDTLLDVHEEDEILAILAHEIGHWKKRHVLKQILLAEIVSLAAFWLAAPWINWPFLYHAFGFQEPVAYVGLFLAGALLGPIGFFLQPAGSALSRHFEIEADDYGAALIGTTEPMERALRRLALENLANLSPHPLYAWYYFGHPPMRVAPGTVRCPSNHSFS